jgi:hypothetical protein
VDLSTKSSRKDAAHQTLCPRDHRLVSVYERFSVVFRLEPRCLGWLPRRLPADPGSSQRPNRLERYRHAIQPGTPWTDDTLLARQIALNREAEAKDGIRRHFQVDWSEVARANQVMSFFVPEHRGHDDLLNAAALVVQAQPLGALRTPTGRRRSQPDL